MHVLTETPRCLGLIASRFQIQNGQVHKLQHAIIPDQTLQMPTFHDGTFQDVAYQLNSFVLHLGDAPTSDHYVTVVLDVDRFLLSDDNISLSFS